MKFPDNENYLMLCFTVVYNCEIINF